MNPNHIPFGIPYQRHKPILTNREFALMNFAADFGCDSLFVRAIFARKVHNGVNATGIKISDPGKTAEASAGFGCRDAPSFDVPRARVHFAEMEAKSPFVEELGSVHIGHVDFKPPNRAFHFLELSRNCVNGQAIQRRLRPQIRKYRRKLMISLDPLKRSTRRV